MHSIIFFISPPKKFTCDISTSHKKFQSPGLIPSCSHLNLNFRRNGNFAIFSTKLIFRKNKSIIIFFYKNFVKMHVKLITERIYSTQIFVWYFVSPPNLLHYDMYNDSNFTHPMKCYSNTLIQLVTFLLIFWMFKQISLSNKYFQLSILHAFLQNSCKKNNYSFYFS